jgi:hypothetical protein
VRAPCHTNPYPLRESSFSYNRRRVQSKTWLKAERSYGVDGERIDTAGRVERMGPPFALKYGTDYALRDEVANEAVFALFTDDDRVRERVAQLVGSRVQAAGTKLPEESDDNVTKMNVTEVDPA